MAMDAGKYDVQFQAMGSVIAYANDISAVQTTVDSGMEAIGAKMVDDYTVIAKPLSSAISMTNSITNAITTQATLSKNVVTSYLNNITKVDLGSTETSVTGVLNDLNTDMIAQSETVLLSGVFWTYYNDNYSVELNSATVGNTIDDAWAQ